MFAPYERSLQVCFWGRQKKQVERLFFCSGIIKVHRFDLAFAYDVSFHIAFFFVLIKKFKKKKKKKLGRICRIFFSWLCQISYVFSPDISILCRIDLLCLI